MRKGSLSEEEGVWGISGIGTSGLDGGTAVGVPCALRLCERGSLLGFHDRRNQSLAESS